MTSGVPRGSSSPIDLLASVTYTENSLDRVENLWPHQKTFTKSLEDGSGATTAGINGQVKQFNQKMDNGVTSGRNNRTPGVVPNKFVRINLKAIYFFASLQTYECITSLVRVDQGLVEGAR